MTIRVGDQAITESRLQPTGIIRLGTERLDARSSLGVIEVGVIVVVIGESTDGLLVRPHEDGARAEELPNFGQPLFRSPLERRTAIMEKLESAHQEEIRVLADRGRYWSGSVGALSLGAAAASCWNWLVDQTDSPAAYLLGSVLIGALWGVVFFELVYHVLWNLDSAYRRIAGTTSIVGLLSSAVAAAWLVPSAGFIPGLLAAIAVAAVMAASVLIVIILLGS